MGGPLTYKPMRENETLVHYDSGNGWSGDLHFIREGGVDNLFLHLEVSDWSKSLLKELRPILGELLDLAKEREIESISFVVEKERGTKFHSLLRPLDYELEVDGNIVGGWFTEVKNGH